MIGLHHTVKGYHMLPAIICIAIAIPGPSAPQKLSPADRVKISESIETLRKQAKLIDIFFQNDLKLLYKALPEQEQAVRKQAATIQEQIVSLEKKLADDKKK